MVTDSDYPRPGRRRRPDDSCIRKLPPTVDHYDVRCGAEAYEFGIDMGDGIEIDEAQFETISVRIDESFPKR